jgi:selenocysteine lyase/cysteine desulfurase
MKRLGLLDRGGAVRVGLSLYNTGDEVSRFLSIMENMVQGRE